MESTPEVCECGKLCRKVYAEVVPPLNAAQLGEFVEHQDGFAWVTPIYLCHLCGEAFMANRGHVCVRERERELLSSAVCNR